MLDKDICEYVGPLAFVPYVTACKEMDEIVDAGFSLSRLDPEDKLNVLFNNLSKALSATMKI